MRKAEQPLTPGADKLAVAIEDDDRVRRVAIETVNTVFRIDRHRACFHVEPFGRALPIFVHLVGVFAAADDRIHWRSPLFYGLSNARLRGAAIAFDMKDPRRGLAEDRAPLARGQRRCLDDRAGIEIADAEGIIRAEHSPVGANDIA